MSGPFIKNAIVTFDGAPASDEVRNVSFAPTVNTVTWDPISGNAVSDATLGAWNCTFEYGQIWDQLDSVANKLHDNFGDEVELVFQPQGAAGATIKATVVVVPGTVGGTAGVATSSVTLPCKAKPVITQPAG